MANEFDRLYAAGKVYRGNEEVSDGSMPRHYGAYYDGAMHIDARHLDAAHTGADSLKKRVITTLLHEAAHALGENHTGESAPWTSVPFKFVNAGDPNSCVAY